jgi:PTS system mannose-specific IID component
MQGLGFLYNLMIGTKKDLNNKIIKTHKGFFNTHPYMASYIIGATIRAYDEGKPSANEIKKFVSVAQSSFASAGDLLFWQTLRPSLLLISVILGLKLGITGPLVFILCYNFFHLYHRIKGITDGYNMGWNVIYVLKSKRFTVIQQVFEILGAFFSGLTVSLVILGVNSFILIPLTVVFVVLLLKQYSGLLIILTILFIIIIAILI